MIVDGSGVVDGRVAWLIESRRDVITGRRVDRGGSRRRRGGRGLSDDVIEAGGREIGGAASGRGGERTRGASGSGEMILDGLLHVVGNQVAVE